MSQCIRGSHVEPLILSWTLRRDRVFSFLVMLGALSRRQVQSLAFPQSDYGSWKCRTELKRMYDAGFIKRGRSMKTKDYVYWVEKKPKDLSHTLGVSQVYVQLASVIDHFEREYKCSSNLIADAYLTVEGKPYFLEYHSIINHKDFAEKVTKYESYAQSREWDAVDWPMPGKFARILVVTENERDKMKIQGKVKNSILSWVVTTIDELSVETLSIKEKIVWGAAIK